MTNFKAGWLGFKILLASEKGPNLLRFGLHRLMPDFNWRGEKVQKIEKGHVGEQTRQEGKGWGGLW